MNEVLTSESCTYVFVPCDRIICLNYNHMIEKILVMFGSTQLSSSLYMYDKGEDSNALRLRGVLICAI